MFKSIRLVTDLVLAVLLSATLLFCSPALAVSTCNTASTGNVAVNAGALSIPANAAPGTVVKSVQTSTTVQCRDLNGQNTYTNHIDLLPAKTLVAGYDNVYQTNIDGLGVRFTFSNSSCTNASAVIIKGTGKTGFDCPYTTGTSYVPSTLKANIDFVVTGKLPASATLTAISEIRMYYVTTDSGGPWTQTSPISGVASGSITAATCSVNQASVDVKLAPVSIADLSSQIGKTAAPKPFSLSVNCSTGIKTFVTLTDSSNIANRSTILGLTSGSSAQGVGIQILNGSDTPIAYGPDSAAPGNLNQFLLGTAAGGSAQYPLKAQYISTGHVRAGSVQAIATFTFSYQ